MSKVRLNDTWQQKWHSDDAEWQVGHLSDVYSGLKNNFLTALPKGETGEGKRALVPLCGKTLDMKWLCHQGMNVVGVEAIEKPLVEFFQENQLSYERKSVKDFEVFTANDSNLQLYKGNLFQFSPDDFDEKFDFIWDRGSLVAVEVKDQQRYVNLIASLMKKGATGLLECFEYDQSLRQEQPFALFSDNLKVLFKDLFHFEELSRIFNETNSIGIHSYVVIYKLQRL